MILRSVETGSAPDGVLAFVMVDPATRARRIWAVATAIVIGVAVVGAGLGHGWSWTTCVALSCGIVAVLSTPTVEDADGDGRQPMLVVTDDAILLRDLASVRAWRFVDLAGAQVSRYAHRIDLILVARDGGRSFIDCRVFEGGARLPEIVATHVPLTRL